MNCPVCKTALEQAGRTFACDKCQGAWIRAEVLVPMLEERASTLVELDWQPAALDLHRTCPECGVAMHTVKLGTVTLDRHEPHGVWFDAKELADVLEEAKQFKADLPPHEGLLHKLRRIFARD